MGCVSLGSLVLEFSRVFCRVFFPRFGLFFSFAREWGSVEFCFCL